MSTSRMVLRSLHLPEDTDEALRTVAFQLRLSKADLVRQLIDVGFRKYIAHEKPVSLISKANAGEASERELMVLRAAIEKLRFEIEAASRRASADIGQPEPPLRRSQVGRPGYQEL